MRYNNNKRAARVLLSLMGLSAASVESNTVEITYTAEVQKECAFVDNNTSRHSMSLNFGTLIPGSSRQERTQSVDLSIDCNAPFAFTITSLNQGVLKVDGQQASVSHSDHFDSMVAYSVTMNAELHGGDQDKISIVCSRLPAVTESDVCTGNSDTSIAIQQNATLSVELESIDSKVLLAGTYKDILTLSITTDL